MNLKFSLFHSRFLLRSLFLVFCIGSWSIVSPIGDFAIATATANMPPAPELSSQELSQLAQSITVKVFAGETSGSGIIVRREGQVYTVVTNEHVLLPGYGKPYRIQTPDGRIYVATIPKTVNFNGDDLGLLQFSSSTVTYAVASLDNSARIAEGDEVFAAGFPFSGKGFVFKSGKISLVLDKALEGGYQIGYTNDIEKGMSGGPLLNLEGKVVGINGRHAYPLWGDGYIFKDGSLPQASLQAQLIQLSWAVPIQTLTQEAEELGYPHVRRSALRSSASLSQTENHETRSPNGDEVPSPSIPQPNTIKPKSPPILPPNGWLW